MSRTQRFSPPQRIQNLRSRSCKKTPFAPQLSGCVIQFLRVPTTRTSLAVMSGEGRGGRCACPTAPPLPQISPSSGTATTRTWCVLVHDLPTESSVWHQPKGRVFIRCSTTTHSLQYTYLNDLVNLNEFSGASLQ